MFYDSNDIQLSTATDAVTSEDVAKKYEAWNWKVITIDGNDPDAIRGALDQAKQVKGQPTLIIGKTVMGKGAVKPTEAVTKTIAPRTELLSAVMLMSIPSRIWAEIPKIRSASSPRCKSFMPAVPKS